MPVSGKVIPMTRDELIDLLSRTPERVAAIVAAVPASELSSKPAADAFSIRENVHHIRDLDVDGFSVRLERLLSETDPVLPDVDGAALARGRCYNERPHEQALGELTRARAASIARLRTLGAADWAREGRLEPVGRVTIARLIELWWEHDRGHLAELEQLQKRAASQSSVN